jgi:hypothetical protein
MSVTRVIRYVTEPECTDENARLVGAVLDDLSAMQPVVCEATTLGDYSG